MTENDIALMAHLMRRAGFGAPYGELRERAAKGYEATVEEMLYPETQPKLRHDRLLRYRTAWLTGHSPDGVQEEWVYSMVNTQRPLEEKIALFWHSIFCTGEAKCEHPAQQRLQLDMFRRQGLGNFRDLLLELARDPAMVFYLDNCMSHKNAINENWGRELLELFSIGAGRDGHANYSEEDVQACARAFTGWTVTNGIPRYPYGKYPNYFMYDSNDHDDNQKTFLGETGRFNGEDVIDIICKQPATARFVSRWLYNFFVADEPPVATWQRIPPRDPEAVSVLEDEYFRSNFDIRCMLRALFNSDFFKESQFAKVKSPVETVVGTMRLAGDYYFPKPGLNAMALNVRFMGQDLLNPPTVEGWHTGKDWIDSGTLLERINFTAEKVGNLDAPGIRAMVRQFDSQGPTVTADALVNLAAEMLGSYQLERGDQEPVGSPGPGGRGTADGH